MTITRRAWANDSPNTMTARAPYSTNSTPRCSILITAGGAAPLITGCSSDAALPRWSMVPTAGLLAFVEADPAAPRAGDSIASQRTRAAFAWPGHGRGQRDPRGNPASCDDFVVEPEATTTYDAKKGPKVPGKFPATYRRARCHQGPSPAVQGSH